MPEMKDVQPLPWHAQTHITLWGVYDANDLIVAGGFTREEARFVCAAVNHFEELCDMLTAICERLAQAPGADPLLDAARALLGRVKGGE